MYVVPEPFHAAFVSLNLKPLEVISKVSMFEDSASLPSTLILLFVTLYAFLVLSNKYQLPTALYGLIKTQAGRNPV